MEHIGVDAALNDVGGEIDALQGQRLDEGLRDDAPAHVTAARTRYGKVPRLIDFDGEFKTEALGEGQNRVREKRPGRASAYNADSGAIANLQLHPPFLLRRREDFTCEYR
jgi:hypothetical protein